MSLQAVIWDFGGVLTTSPFESFNRYEAERGLPRDFIRGINATNPETNAWAQFESSAIDLDTFDEAFAEEARAQGHDVPGKDVIALLSGDVRPRMVEALKMCKAHFHVACITNNVRSGSGPGMASSAAKAAAVGEVMALFERFDLDRHFVTVQTADTHPSKPHPSMIEAALSETGTPWRATYSSDA